MNKGKTLSGDLTATFRRRATSALYPTPWRSFPGAGDHLDEAILFASEGLERLGYLLGVHHEGYLVLLHDLFCESSVSLVFSYKLDQCSQRAGRLVHLRPHR